MTDPAPDLSANLLASLRRCRECREPVDEDGTWTGDCPGGSGARCDECFACSCDGSC